MSTSKQKPNNDQTNSEEQNNKSKTNQASLFDTDKYQHSTSDGLPEDIEREFDFPDETNIELLDDPAEEIIQRIRPPWEKAKDVFDRDTEIPKWEGEMQADFLGLIPRYLQPSVEYVKICITELGWLVNVVDRGNVAMFRLWLGREDFDTYKLETEGVVGINLDDLSKTLTNINNNDKITVNYTNKRKMVIDNGTETSFPLVDPDSLRTVPSIPNTTTEQKLTLPTKEICEITNRIGTMSEYIKIKSNENKNTCVIESENDSIQIRKKYSNFKDITTIKHRKKAKRKFEKEINRDVKSIFTNEWFEELFSGLRKSDRQDTVTLNFGDEMPIQLYKEISSNTNFKMVLAPRVR